MFSAQFVFSYFSYCNIFEEEVYMKWQFLICIIITSALLERKYQ